MTASVLVAYGTRHGSTAEVAAAVSDELRGSGLEVELLPAGSVEVVAGYDGVVLGGALYMGRLHPDVRGLLAEFREDLSRVPVAVFAMGPKTIEQHDLDESRGQLEAALAKTPEVVPFSVAIFGGVVDPKVLHFPFNRMPASDARDWEVIRAWAAQIAPTFAVKEVPAYF